MNPIDAIVAELKIEARSTRKMLERFVVIRSTTLNHLIHHRGQLSVYLRMLGVPLPAIYGPTADES